VSDVTHILAAIEQGDHNAADQLLPLVYEELRKLAGHRMANEAAGQTLQPTALVHEAWMRLVGRENPKFENRAHFFAAAAEAMRRILIENVRRRAALCHGGGRLQVDLDDALSAIASPIAPTADGRETDELIALDAALTRLEATDPPKAQLVKLRYFVGLSLEEAADALGISRATAYRHWAYARAWLRDQVRAEIP